MTRRELARALAGLGGFLLLAAGPASPATPATAAPPSAAPPAATVTGAGTPDPFYLGLLRDGRIAYDRADYPTAAKDLRLACFGLLNEPPALTDCLVRLAVAQGAGNDAEGFRETFRRIAEVEDRFGAYAKAPLPPEIRTAFEQRLVVLIPAATLETIPVWKPLLLTKAEVQIAALPAKERRKELDARLAKEPRSLTWNLLAAELDLEEGKAAPAITHAEQAAATAPQDPRATCLRGLARAYGRRCQEALVDLEPCPFAARELRYATALLGCRVEVGAWRKAEEQVRSLTPEQKDDRRIAALIQQVTQHASAPTASAPPADKTVPPAGRPAERPVVSTPAPPKTPAAAPPSVPAPKPAPEKTPTEKPAPTPRPLSTAEREALERARRLLAAEVSSKDLKEALRLAREVADAHPESKEAQYLAGEAAYRNSRWADAVAAFRRGGEPGDDHPELLFYLAVSLYEAGDRPAAATALKRSLPKLQKTPYIESYVRRILGPDAAP
ncbi:MAG TPA: tetratricopeptide repeat protein [Thermoanaerobaculia bacterium]|nr:tetratricopeptide repeat protein [Thermoanaerobaculia bacterium]